MASSTVIPIRLISVETDAALLIFIFPEEVPPYFFAAGEASSSISTRSLMLTRERKIPIWTYRSPLAFGSVCTVPFKFMDSTRTESPMRSFLGTLWLTVSFFFMESAFSLALILSRTRLRSFSILDIGACPCPYLLKLRMVSSARSLASLRICTASSLALRRISSRLLSRRSFLAVSFFFKSSISALYFWISSCSFSMVIRLCSRLASISSKLTSRSLRRPLASSMIFSASPSLELMANALLFPGIPISRR